MKQIQIEAHNGVIFSYESSVNSLPRNNAHEDHLEPSPK